MNYKKHAERTSAKVLYRFTAVAAVLLAACLVFMMPVSAWEVDSSWGSNYESTTEFTIQDTGDLAQFATMVNNGKNFQGKTVKLSTDINLENQEWTPIGSSSKSFQGTFDGNNKTISNLNFSTTVSSLYVGLFGCIDTLGIVTNLAVSGKIDISGTQALSAGSIAGDNKGTISNSYSTVSVQATSSKSVYAGGIAGKNSGTIQNCYSTGTVAGTRTGNPGTDNAYSGGIVGQNTGTIQNCYSTGIVSAFGNGVAGGIVGQNSVETIQYCYALNKEVSSPIFASRIAGWSLSNSYQPLPLTDKDNFGWKGMSIISPQGTDYTVPGRDTCAGAIQYDNNWDTTIWDMDGEGTYLLPVLNGFTNYPSATPTHLTQITVTFNANGGTPVQTTQNILEGTKVTEPTGVTKTGYTLEGWYKESTFANKWDFDTTVCKDDYASLTLYANWTPITYTVKFYNNSVTGTMEDQSIMYTESMVLSDNTFTAPADKVFNGWATAENGEPVYPNMATVTGTMLSAHANQDAVVNLYACWITENQKKPTYTVTFNSNGGDNVASQTVFSNGKATDPKLTRTGHTLNGWYNGETQWNFESNTVTSDITLTAKWTVNQYTITFANTDESTINAITQDYGTAVSAPANPTKTGHTFAGWDKEIPATMPAEDTTITAQWNANQYTITFANTGESTINAITQDYGSTVAAPANPTKTGYTFAGWDKEIPATMPAEDVTITASWTTNTYCVTFNANGGSGTMAQQQFSYDVEQALSANAFTAPSGKIFGGWAITSSQDNPSYADGEVVKNLIAHNGDFTLYATWTNHLCYTVKFDANGGTGTMANQEFEYDVTEVLNASTFTAPAGKLFNGWNTKADGSGTAYPANYADSKITSINNAKVTLYAQWKAQSTGGGGSSSSKTTYTVTFNANGGTGEMYPQTFVSGKEKALTLNFFTRDGYVFAGWATSADGAVVYTNGESIKVSKSVTLYAVWNAETPDVTDEPEQPDTPEQPDEPTTPGTTEESETPAPLIGILAGLGAAVLLRRK